MQKTEIVNFGYGSLGVSYAVLDFDTENSKQAMLARRYFQRSLDTVVEANTWSFLRMTKPLALLGNDVGGFKYHYNLPADCMVVRQIAKDGHFIKNIDMPHQFYPAWEFHGSAFQIVTNVDHAHAEYTRRVMQDDSMPSYFARAVSAQFALDIAPMLILDKFTVIKARLEADLERDINRAISYDSGRENDTSVQVSSYELYLR